MKPKVGVALAVHNSRDQTRECLNNLFNSDYSNLYVVVVDDGSVDGTWEMLQQDYPQVITLRGDGNLWWTGATNMAVRACLQANCEFVLLLNPDVIVEPTTISMLVNASKLYGDAIVSPLVLDYDKPNQIWEAGHTWGPIFPKVPIIWTARHLYKRGTPVLEIPQTPYKTVSVVGRGGMISRKAFETLGLFDEKRLPHYGADADMAARASCAGFPMYIAPDARVRLHTEQTGMLTPKSWSEALTLYYHRLFSRKHGEALRTLYYWNVNNLPLHVAIPSYLFMVALNAFRYWQSFLKTRRHHLGRKQYV